MGSPRQALAAEVGTAVQAYQRSTDALDDAVADRLGINRTDLRCLDWLYEGARTAGQLGGAIGLSSAATTTLLDRLERKGLVRRYREPSDRRKVFVELTEAARSLTGELYGPIVMEGTSVLERLTRAELAGVRDYLRRSTELTDRHRARIRALPPKP